MSGWNCRHELIPMDPSEIDYSDWITMIAAAGRRREARRFWWGYAAGVVTIAGLVALVLLWSCAPAVDRVNAPEELGPRPLGISAGDSVAISVLVFGIEPGEVWRCGWITAEGDTIDFAGGGTLVGNRTRYSALFKQLVQVPPTARWFVMRRVWTSPTRRNQ